MKNTKVIFMGTPEFSVPILKYLIENTNVVLVVTQEDKEVGRDKKIVFSPVKKTALESNIPVFQPHKIRNDYEIISEINPDIIITCAYGQIIPEEILNIPRLGCLNIHASLLPKYRGASPMQAAILNGDTKTGVTLMYMDKNMDTGDIIDYLETDIDENDNLAIVHDKLSLLGVNLLEKTLLSVINGENKRLAQDNSKASYTTLIKREDELLNFNDKGKNIINKIRAFNPYPYTYFIYNGIEIKLIEAKYIKEKSIPINSVLFEKNKMYIGCSDGAIELIKIKPFGKKEMLASAYANGINKLNGSFVNQK